ncbi:MFS transporter [Novosphingobium sp.]|uniref:MFS transporter n=1 Tax=Novosphingobium sp. TaxID=1874826 RepID=UPI0025CE080E|nr:MFS transporter [Novosphingobium sp.]MCC6924694.1 MFS transporter [Novosphingobium sp.]
MTELAGARPLSNKWVVLALMLAIALLNYGDRYLLAGLAQPIKLEFGMSDGFMGLLMGPAFALLYSLVAVPIAIHADRTSKVAIICAGCVMWSLFTVLSGLATSAGVLALARVGVGIGEAAFQAPAYALLAAYFLPEQRGKAYAVMGMAVYFGQLLGYVGGPAIAARGTWHDAFEVLGGIGIAIGVLAWLILREPPRPALPTTKVHEPLWPQFQQLWAAPSFRWMSLGMALGTLSGVSFGMWGPALFERAYGLSTQQASGTFGLAFGLPGLLGMLVFGFAVDHLARRDRRWLLRLAAGALFSATALILLVTWMPSIVAARWLAVPSGLLGGGWSVGIFTALQYVLPDRSRVTGTALAMLVINLLGYVTGPFIAGQLSDMVMGEGAYGLRVALSLVIPLGFVGAALMWLAGHSLEQDRARLA